RRALQKIAALLLASGRQIRNLAALHDARPRGHQVLRLVMLEAVGCAVADLPNALEIRLAVRRARDRLCVRGGRSRACRECQERTQHSKPLRSLEALYDEQLRRPAQRLS